MAVMEGFLLQAPAPVTLLGAVLVLLAFYLLSPSPDSAREPPGPRPLPLLGNLLLLDLKNLHASLCELSEKHGSVFTVHFGPKKVVVLAGYKTVKQALVDYAEEFGERDVSPLSHDIVQGHGIVFANGDSWREMRRFALSTLRDFGMGEPFNTTQPVNYAVSNIISSIVYGSRFEYTDPVFQKMVDRSNENIRLLGSAEIQLFNLFPRLGRCLGQWLGNRALLLKNSYSNIEEMKGLVKRLQESLNPQQCRCFVDCFLIRQQEEAGQKGSHFHQNNLIMTVGNLFAAGTDTTATTLRWGLLLMAKYPHIQDRVQEEMSRVIGDRQPRTEDRRSLPYTNAVIHEIQRLANISPLSLPHVTSSDITFQGFLIKKGTTVIPLLASVMQDESEWKNPYSFNPDHFLDEEGHFIKRDAFLPFSAGRRACLGESLARMELFLFFTSLLQRFRFSVPPGVSETELDLTPIVGATLSPSPHRLCAISRA
ncbi:cytochrome P450 2K4-like isoform X2 [Megalops cyprinoides]|uniref:cytochrome P450 2K4-like isoform X2 n=1 Tax=Megalops cyprinoides TaxID=118141 RepID=UPI001864423B|nr:cytochrome P450 2K4-like isoform X2 [Megalops cyprinoides]